MSEYKVCRPLAQTLNNSIRTAYAERECGMSEDRWHSLMMSFALAKLVQFYNIAHSNRNDATQECAGGESDWSFTHYNGSSVIDRTRKNISTIIWANLRKRNLIESRSGINRTCECGEVMNSTKETFFAKPTQALLDGFDKALLWKQFNPQIGMVHGEKLGDAWGMSAYVAIETLDDIFDATLAQELAQAHLDRMAAVRGE